MKEKKAPPAMVAGVWKTIAMRSMYATALGTIGGILLGIAICLQFHG